MKSTEQKWSGRWDSNPQPPTWESTLGTLYFQYLENRSRKINVHATHTVHAVPDLRVAGGRFLSCVAVRDRRFEAYCFVPDASRYSRFVVAKLTTCEDPCRVNAIRSRLSCNTYKSSGAERSGSLDSWRLCLQARNGIPNCLTALLECGDSHN